MKRTIIYHINAEEDGLTIGQFLKRKKYSGQNLTQLKKQEQGILLNSKPAYVIHKLAEGDTLTINILAVSYTHLPFLNIGQLCFLNRYRYGHFVIIIEYSE